MSCALKHLVFLKNKTFCLFFKKNKTFCFNFEGYEDVFFANLIFVGDMDAGDSSDWSGWKKSGSGRAGPRKMAFGRRAFGLGPGPGFWARARPEPITRLDSETLSFLTYLFDKLRNNFSERWTKFNSKELVKRFIYKS